MRNFYVLILWAVLGFLPFIASREQPSRPDQIIEIFRHGARGPFIGFDKSWPQDQKGQLTPAGMHQHYVLGRVLARKYPHIFDGALLANELYILANKNSRCIQSAYFHRGGLYKRSLGINVEENLQSSAIPPFRDPIVSSVSVDDDEVQKRGATVTLLPQVHVVDERKADVFKRARSSVCPNNALWEKQNHNDTKALEAWGIFKETIDNVKKNLPRTIRLKNAFDVPIIGDALLVNEFHKKSMRPFGISDENSELIRNFTYAYSWFILHIEYGQEKQRQLNAFQFVTEILNQLEAFRKGDKDFKRAALYSGHDYNIYSILSAFGIVTEECLMANFLSSVEGESSLPYPTCYFPFYASNLVFEMYNKTNRAYVKVLYNNDVIRLCKGKEACEYNDFIRFARNAIGGHTPKSYKKSCGVKGFESDEEDMEVKDLLSRKEGLTQQEEEEEEFEENFSKKKSKRERAYSSRDFKEVKGKRVGKKLRLKSVIVTAWIVLGALILFAFKFKDQILRIFH